MIYQKAISYETSHDRPSHTQENDYAGEFHIANEKQNIN